MFSSYIYYYEASTLMTNCRQLDPLEMFMNIVAEYIYVRIRFPNIEQMNYNTDWLINCITAFHLSLNYRNEFCLHNNKPVVITLDEKAPNFMDFMDIIDHDTTQLAHLTRYNLDNTIDMAISHVAADGKAVFSYLSQLGPNIKNRPEIKIPMSQFDFFKDRIPKSPYMLSYYYQQIIIDPVNNVQGRGNIYLKLCLNDYWKKRLTQKFYVFCAVLKLKLLEYYNKNLLDLIKQNELTYQQPFCVDYRYFAGGIDQNYIGNFYNTVAIEMSLDLDQRVEDIVQHLTAEQNRIFSSDNLLFDIFALYNNGYDRQFSQKQIYGIEFSSMGIIKCAYDLDLIVLYPEAIDKVPDCFLNCYTVNDEFRINFTYGPKYNNVIAKIYQWMEIIYSSMKDSITLGELIRLCK